MGDRWVRSATVSDCGTFRYHLAREWRGDNPMLFVMLNPSTADGREDDPTIRKCIGFALRNGFGSIQVVNLFAYRATDPRDLKRAGYPVGPENLATIREAAQDVTARGGMVVCAWGSHARGLGMATTVTKLLRDSGVQLHALHLLGDGTPGHPLMLSYECKPFVLEAAQ